MTTQNYFKALLLIATCLFFLSCSSKSSNSKLVELHFGDSITFKTQSGLAVPLDFQTEKIESTFDVATQSNINYAHLVARVKESGNPYFLCNCSIQRVNVNGASAKFERVSDPDNKNSFVLIDRPSAIDEVVMIDVEYLMNKSEYSFQNGGIGFLISTNDLMEGSYFELYGPANYEWDQLKLDWDITVKGAASSHQIFTNGSYTFSNDGTSQTWKISFPDYFTTSSSFLHITNRTDLVVKRFDMPLQQKTISVTLYGPDAGAVNTAAQNLPSYFSELENDYGPYAHDWYVAYIATGGGGMEYVGGAITSNWALSHEVTHSWFARGVMPADGRSGWIDEAVASWRDYGYKRASGYGQRAATNLANFSSFERFTPTNCYKDGRALLAELDYVVADKGGFKKVLSDLFAKYKRQTITTQMFTDFVESYTTADLRPLFTNNLYGNFMVLVPASVASAAQQTVDFDMIQDSKEPRPLTHDEVIKLR